MTVNYSMVMSKQGVGTVFSLLARWRGSIVKVCLIHGSYHWLFHSLLNDWDGVQGSVDLLRMLRLRLSHLSFCSGLQAEINLRRHSCSVQKLDWRHSRNISSYLLHCCWVKLYSQVTFILGFYVSVVFSRWQEIVNGIPWMDATSFFLSYITSDPNPSRAVIYRRSIVRYLMAGQILALRAVSLQVILFQPIRVQI